MSDLVRSRIEKALITLTDQICDDPAAVSDNRLAMIARLVNSFQRLNGDEGEVKNKGRRERDLLQHGDPDYVTEISRQ
ncbi:MAG: hypothetical protein JRI34_00905 [Deltaproteobacteria bacterium]|nr:hypothetical protein [Deltaproteobacteria bacterium]